MWFELINYWQGKLLCASIVLLILFAVQSHSVNQEIDKINEANSSNYNIKSLPTASFYGLIAVIIILVIALAAPLTLNE